MVYNSVESTIKAAWGSLEVVLVATFTSILIGGSAILALADYARPGDMLYKVDRAAESVQFAFTMSDEDRVELDLERIEERYQELYSLIENNAKIQDLNLAKSEFEEATNNFLMRTEYTASDITSPTMTFLEKSQNQQEELEYINEKVPEEKKFIVNQAREISQKGWQRASEVVPEKSINEIMNSSGKGLNKENIPLQKNKNVN